MAVTFDQELSERMVSDLRILADDDHYCVAQMCPDGCREHHYVPRAVADQLEAAIGEVARLGDLYHASRANNEQAMAMLNAKDVTIADLASWCRYALANWAPAGSDKAEAMQASLDKAGAL